MKASEFLQKHLDFVSKQEEEKPGSVVMLRYVSKFDLAKNCGTVCCMEGWLPVSFPAIFSYRKDYRVVDRQTGYLNAHSVVFNYGIDRVVWEYLTGIYYPFNIDGYNLPYITTISEFDRVHDGWTKVIRYYKDRGN